MRRGVLIGLTGTLVGLGLGFGFGASIGAVGAKRAVAVEKVLSLRDRFRQCSDADAEPDMDEIIAWWSERYGPLDIGSIALIQSNQG